MPNKAQERWCLAQLMRHIRSRCPGVKLRSKDGDEPPDFLLFVGDQTFAVEITSITVQNERTKWLSLSELIQKIKSESTNSGELSGRYLISARAELPNKRGIRKALEACIRKYLGDTKAMSRSPGRELLVDGILFGYIEKYAPGGAELHIAGGLTCVGACETEIRSELRGLVNERLSDKRKKLATCPHPRILVLHDCYGLERETAQWERQIRESSDAVFFRAVFLITSSGDQVWIGDEVWIQK